MIEMQNVSFSYPDSADGGLKNINLTIPDEQCVLLCGRSGCGKTTLTRLINGLIPQFFAGELTGKVLLDGENLFDLPMYRIAEKVGSVFQNPRTQFFNVDTDSEIAFGMENEAVPQEQMGQRVVETAKALRIENLLGRNIFALSGGEKQKIAFASVYAMNPQIYLLDEPSSNLDMAAIHDLRAHLRLIKSQGKTIVVAEHRLYYLMDVADRIVYLDNGHIAGDWTPEQFRLLSTEKRQSMGLRALDLQDEKPICAAVPKQPPVLELQNVSLAYKKQPVLRNLSLQAAPGDIIAIVGHNGAGKTTFSRALCGLHKETSGSYLWNGNPQKPKERMKSSYMVMENRKHHVRGGLPVMHVIDEGIFRGFIPINHHWVNDDPGTYYDISNSVRQQPNRAKRIEKSSLSAFDLQGYQVVRGQFLQIRYEGPTLNITNERIAFNKFCMQKFDSVAYVQLLLHPAERKLAIRPCRESDAHSIRWRPDPEKPLYSKTLNCQHFGNALYSIMKWNPDYTYKVRGTWASRRGEQIIVFNLPNAVPVMLIPADDGGEEAKQKKRITLCPEEWENDFGDEFYEHTVENGFYYIAPNTEWHSQARSVVAPGVEQYMGPSQEQLQMTIDDLLRGTNKIDGNKGN